MDQFKKWYTNQEVLVTGGAGFIGSHLVEALVSNQARVTVFDNLSTGSKENLSSVMDTITFIQGDICSPAEIKKAVHNKAYIFHTAALVSVQQSLQDAELCREINVQGTKNIIDAADPLSLKGIVFSSTAAIYGRFEGASHEELPADPLSPYAETKFQAELLLQEAAQTKGLKAGVLRYFNVFGERQNPFGTYASVIPRFLNALQNDIPLTIFGDGLQMRDFISVKEIVRANLTAALMATQKPVFCNVASGNAITLLTLITQLEKQVNKKARAINHAPPREGEVRYSFAKIDRLKKLYDDFNQLDKADDISYLHTNNTYQQKEK